MNFESLKSSKFGAFKGNILTNAIAISGGYNCTNTYRNGSQVPNDSLTDDTAAIHFTDGTSGDLHDTICPVGPSEGQGGHLHPLPTDPFSGDYNNIYNINQVQMIVVW